MKTIQVQVILTLLLGLGSVKAQAARAAWMYFFAAPAGVSAGNGTYHSMGLGGEGLIYKGLGIGTEATGIFVGGWSDATSKFLLFSSNASYYFFDPRSAGKLAPFVTGGYTHCSEQIFGGWSNTNGYNIGGGVTYWFIKRAGLRLEIRDNVLRPKYAESGHYVGFRLGIDLR